MTKYMKKVGFSAIHARDGSIKFVVFSIRGRTKSITVNIVAQNVSVRSEKQKISVLTQNRFALRTFHELLFPNG